MKLKEKFINYANQNLDIPLIIQRLRNSILRNQHLKMGAELREMENQNDNRNNIKLVA